jgi:hypothetical protein
MSKSLQYTKVLEALIAAGGPVSANDVRSIPNIVPSRLSTYLWEIKKNTGYAVRAVRDGRSVVAYELVGSGSAPVAAPVSKPAAPKPAKAKPVKAAVVAPIVVELDDDPVENDPIVNEQSTPKMIASGVVDILDEIDSSVEAFEDESFVREYVSFR